MLSGAVFLYLKNPYPFFISFNKVQRSTSAEHKITHSHKHWRFRDGKSYTSWLDLVNQWDPAFKWAWVAVLSMAKRATLLCPYSPQRAVGIPIPSLKWGLSKVCSFSWRVTFTYLKRSDEKTLPVGFAGRVDTHWLSVVVRWLTVGLLDFDRSFFSKGSDNIS